MEFKKINIEKDDLIVLTVNPWLFDFDKQQINVFINNTKSLFPNNKIIYLSKGMDISSLSEKEMNSIGWYKKNN